jgi:hypothetical protein
LGRCKDLWRPVLTEMPPSVWEPYHVARDSKGRPRINLTVRRRVSQVLSRSIVHDSTICLIELLRRATLGLTDVTHTELQDGLIVHAWDDGLIVVARWEATPKKGDSHELVVTYELVGRKDPQVADLDAAVILAREPT